MPSLRDAKESQPAFATPQKERKRLRYRTFKYITDDFGNEIFIKICSGCQRWLRESDYPNIDKHTGRPKGICYPCKKAYDDEWRIVRREERREYGRNLRRKHLADPVLRELLIAKERKQREKRTPEQNRRYSKNHYERLKSNPQKYAVYLETRRIQARLRRERQGIESVPGRGVGLLKFPKNNSEERLPIDPISEWAIQKSKMYGGNKDLARHCGVNERTITRIVTKDQCNIGFALVDQILTNEGSTFIWDLYSDEYERLLVA